jgi:hypothetical protein
MCENCKLNDCIDLLTFVYSKILGTENGYDDVDNKNNNTLKLSLLYTVV